MNLNIPGRFEQKEDVCQILISELMVLLKGTISTVTRVLNKE